MKTLSHLEKLQARLRSKQERHQKKARQTVQPVVKTVFALSTTDVAVEKHFSVPQVAELWNLDPRTIRKLFGAVKGVLKLRGGEGTKTTLLIPESVLRTVHQQMAI